MGALRNFVTRRFGAALAGILPATRLSFLTQPSGSIAGSTLTQQPVVKAVNLIGILDTNFTGNVTITKVNGTGAITGTATVAAVGGVATFTNLALDTAGHYVVQAAASGLTSVRSGMITTVTSTTLYTQASLNFGGSATSDKGNCGSGASLDNLPNSGAMSAIIRVKRTTAGDNQFVISKHNGAGWYLQFANGTGAVDGCMAASISRATDNAFTLTTTSFTIGTWYDIMLYWQGGAGGGRELRIFHATASTAPVEASYDVIGNGIGVGSITSDAAAELWIGNLQVAPTNPAKAEIAWVAVFNNYLTTLQMDEVRTGFNRNDVAQINAVGTCVLIQRLNGTGTLTDLSTVGTNNCVIGGTTTGTTSDFYVPVMPANSIDPTNSTKYWFTNAFATYAYSTTATSAKISAYRSLEAAYDNQASITVLVDGVYYTQFLATTVADNNFGTVSLPVGSKTVTFVNGPRSRAVGASPPAEGTFLTSIQFNASATDVVPTTPSSTLLYFGDSIFADFLANPVGQYGATSQMREYLRSSRAVMFEGYGGAKLYDYAVDSTAITATVAKIARYNPDYLFTELAANDYSANSWTTTQFQTGWENLLAALHAEMPSLIVYLSTMVTRPGGEGANAGGFTAPNFRTAAANAGANANTAAGTTFVYVLDGPTQLWDGTNSSDASHPNNTGMVAVLANEKTILGV